MKVELHIDRLVVDDAVLGRGSRRAVLEELQRELAARLAAPGAAAGIAGLGAIEVLPPAHPRTPPASGGSPGMRIAVAVAEGLGRG